MKLIVATLLVAITLLVTVSIFGYAVFLIANDIRGMIQHEPEQGWGIFFSLLMLPFLIMSAISLWFSWKFYKRTDSVIKSKS